MTILLRFNVMASVLPILACGMAMAGDVGISAVQGAYRPATLQPARYGKNRRRGGHAGCRRKFGFKYVEVADLGGLSPAEFKLQLDRRVWCRSAAISPTPGSAMTSKASPEMPRHWDFPTSVVRGLTTRAPSMRSSAARRRRCSTRQVRPC